MALRGTDFPKAPVKGHAEFARPGRVLWRTRIEQQAVGDGGIAQQLCKIGGGFNADRLHHGQAEQPLDLADTGNGFLAMQLQQIRLQGLIIPLNVASSASTVRATLPARPRTCGLSSLAR